MGGIYLTEVDEQRLEKAINIGLKPLIGKDTVTRVTHQDGSFRVRFDVYEDGPDILGPHVATWCLSELPGCCGYIVSHWLFINYDYRGCGVANFLQQVKFDIAEMCGYTYITCTTTTDNKVQNHLLEKYGWERVHSGRNKRTGNGLIMWVRGVTA